MNPVLLLTHNCLDLTKRCVQSIRAQEIETTTYIIDNGSTDGTQDWAPAPHVLFDRNCGVSFGWNIGLGMLFARVDVDRVLVVNNDVVLPPYFYRELRFHDVPFVSGAEVTDMNALREAPPLVPANGPPQFSCFLIRRDAWEKVGRFDEGMKFYASDLDYHLRAHKAGIPLVGSNIPYYHERSSTLNHAPAKEQEEIQAQANADRAYFQKKWGFAVGSEEYCRTIDDK